jgi:hypothetical protein
MAFDAGASDLIAGGFAAAAAFSLLRLIVAWRGAARLVRNAAPFTPAPAVGAALTKMACAHRVRTPSILTSPNIRGPAVVGVIRPVILTPMAFGRLSEDEQTAALLHELAHVIRRDFAVNLLCEAAALPGSWHPVIYEIKAGVRRSRELVCDAMASEAIRSRHDYARRLLALAKAFGPEPERGVAMVGLIGASSLEERLMHLIKGEDPRTGGRTRFAAASALAGAVLAPALFLHVAPAVAQAPAPARVQPVVMATPRAMGLAPTLRARVAPIAPKRLKIARAETPPAPFPPPRAMPEPATTPSPTPPTPPTPPAPAVSPEPAAAAWPDMSHFETMIDVAIAQSDAAREAFLKAQVEAAMAALQAHRNELSAAQRERVMANVRHEMETWRSKHMAEDMVRVRHEVHAALESAEVRRAFATDEVRRALHEAAKAADEAHAAQGESPPN